MIKFNNRPSPAESLADTTSHSTVPALRLKMALPDAQVTQGHFSKSCMDSLPSAEPETETSKHHSFSHIREAGPGRGVEAGEEKMKDTY